MNVLVIKFTLITVYKNLRYMNARAQKKEEVSGDISIMVC